MRLVGFAGGFLLGLCCTSTSASELVVTTSSGTVKGRYSDATHGRVREWKGIPYAAAPTGDLRFKPPQPPPAWEGVRQAYEYGHPCMQMTLDGSVAGDEDCLVLNIFAPSASRDRAKQRGLLPVVVTIHGGGQSSGHGGLDPDFTGWANGIAGPRLSAQKEVVYVTFNYRLNTFGFMALSELSAEHEQGYSGAYGNLDQIAALRWVQNNILAFGGDPSQVAITGCSGGGQAVATLVATPLSKGLYSAAFIQSSYSMYHRPLASVEKSYAELIEEKLDCSPYPDRLTCVRSVPAKQLLQNLTDYSMTEFTQAWPLFGTTAAPVGSIIAQYPEEVFRQGNHNAVPLVISSTSQEATLWLTLFGLPASEKAARQLATGMLELRFPEEGDNAEAIAQAVDAGLAMYAGDYLTMLSDLQFACPAVFLAKAASVSGVSPVYHFVFSYESHDAPPGAGVPHGTEVAYQFGNLEMGFMSRRHPSLEDFDVSDLMMGHLVSAAATGDPNHQGTTYWPEFGEAGNYLDISSSQPSVAANFHEKACSHWSNPFPKKAKVEL